MFNGGDNLKNEKKLEDDLQQLGKKIKHHEDNVNFLKHQKNTIDTSILDLQVGMGKLRLVASFSKEENEESKEETIERIVKHKKNSAAALFCQITIKDMIGVVATLAKVDDANLSRLLSNYLGVETMLAVVCKSYEGVKSVESYSRDGSIHAYAASVGSSPDTQFKAINIQHIRPYTGDLVADDPQRRLDLVKPRLINEETPPDFLGFAVNMIIIDKANLYLRETLFYNLFMNLQVYKTREAMMNAIPLISTGAISLDGGVIRSPGVYVLGCNRFGPTVAFSVKVSCSFGPTGQGLGPKVQLNLTDSVTKEPKLYEKILTGPKWKEDIDVKFPCYPQKLNLSVNYYDFENRLKEAKWKKNQTLEDLNREQELLDQAKFKYETKKREFLRFLAESASNATQVAPRESTNNRGNRRSFH